MDCVQCFSIWPKSIHDIVSMWWFRSKVKFSGFQQCTVKFLNLLYIFASIIIIIIINIYIYICFIWLLYQTESGGITLSLCSWLIQPPKGWRETKVAILLKLPRSCLLILGWTTNYKIKVIFFDHACFREAEISPTSPDDLHTFKFCTTNKLCKSQQNSCIAC
jgi:hypothetical protein